MSEFERLLDEYERAICEDGGVPEARAALLAYHERVVRERDNWQETAARHWSNELFYSGLLRDVGSLFPDCYVSDDGSVQDEPLALKVKECVVRELESDKALLAQRDARITNIARIAHDGGLVGLDPYEALDLVRAMSVEHWDRGGSLDDRKGRLSAAILAAREGK